ncbi:TPA: DNA breaking-rejoining protein [Salmonella enterica]|nr:DNA breaking-rejoining protein [Salmonella enterica]
MVNPFDQVRTRLDEVTSARFGRPVLIGGVEYVAVESSFLAEFGALSGEGVQLIIFSQKYKPARDQPVLWQGQDYVVTRWQNFNGKFLVSIEQS